MNRAISTYVKSTAANFWHGYGKVESTTPLFWAVVRTTWKEKREQYESETSGGLDYRRSRSNGRRKIRHALAFGTDTSNAEFRLSTL